MKLNRNKTIFWITFIALWILLEAPRNTDPIIFGTIAFYYFVPLIFFNRIYPFFQETSWFKKWRITFLILCTIVLCLLKIFFEKAWWSIIASLFDYSLTVVTYEGVGLKAYASLLKGYFIFLLLNELFTNSETKNEKEREAESKTIFIKTDKQLVRVIPSDIQFIEGLKDYVKIYTESEVLVTKRTLQSFENELNDREFMRVQKSFIVNLNCISKVVGNTLIIANTRVPIGKTYRQDVEKKLDIRL